MRKGQLNDGYVDGYKSLVEDLSEALNKNLQPPPKMTLSQWANTYGVLSKETSAQTGKFESFPYQNGILDSVTDADVTKVTVMKSARCGYTKCLDHAVGYYLHQDPSPILIVQPRVEDAEDYSKSELSPMLRDTKVLSSLTGEVRARDSGNTILKKTMLNGASITLVGANSPGGFRRITARVILFDEVDGYPKGGAGSEGDQIALGIKRSETFWNRKIVLGSTPTIKGESRIEKSWLESDQRRYYVPCPHCGEYQVLEWGGPTTPHGIKWDKDEDGTHRAETAHYVCIANGCIIEENDKLEMLERGEWRAQKPFRGHAGFHIWSGYSLFHNARWSNLVAEWLEVKRDPLARQTFVNLVLGETYEDVGERPVGEAALLARREIWSCDVPDGVAEITIGADVQDERVELETVGWGADEESWSIDYHVIEGNFGQPETQAALDQYLSRSWKKADGKTLTTSAVCVDSGGHHTQDVYKFCKARIGRRVWAIKGESASGGKRSPVWPTKKPLARYRSQYRPIIIGVNAAKDVIRHRLHLGQPGPGYMHFPADRDKAYFGQLTSERLVVKESGGQRYRVWELPSHRTNEALDCRVYAYAALCGLQHFGFKLNKRAAQIGAKPDPVVLAPRDRAKPVTAASSASQPEIRQPDTAPAALPEVPTSMPATKPMPSVPATAPKSARKWNLKLAH